MKFFKKSVIIGIIVMLSLGALVISAAANDNSDNPVEKKQKKKDSPIISLGDIDLSSLKHLEKLEGLGERLEKELSGLDIHLKGLEALSCLENMNFSFKGLKCLKNLENLQGLRGLESLKNLKALKALEGLDSISSLDFDFDFDFDFGNIDIDCDHDMDFHHDHTRKDKTDEKNRDGETVKKDDK